MDPRTTPLKLDLKRDENIYVASERSAASFDGMRFRKIYVDNVELFEEGVHGLVVNNAMIRADAVVATATPDYSSTVDLLRALEIRDKRERERMASWLKRKAQQDEHDKMMAFMMAKIAESEVQS